MQYVIWGTGLRGRKIFEFLGQNVNAYIDSDIHKQGTMVLGKPVISYEEYKKSYADSFIIVSPFEYESIVKQLEDDGIYRYFNLKDEAQEIIGRYGRRDRVMENPFTYQKDEVCIVWGINLYSLYLLEQFREQGVKEVYLVPHEEMSTERRREIQKIASEVYKEDLSELETEGGNLFLAVKPKEEIKSSIYKVHIAYEFSWMDCYYNPQLEQYKNKYQGEKCFIVATGPSLRMSDLDVLYENTQYTFSMNKIFCAFEHTKWRPDFYMVVDRMITDQNLEEIEKLDLPNMFFPICDCDINNHNVQYFYFNSCRNWRDKPQVSEDVARVTYCTATVLFCAFQFAFYMGFKEIYLLGTDFNYGIAGQQGNHFYKEEDKSNGVFQKETYWEECVAAKQYADIHGIKIYNATRGGKLEVFERVNFDSLF